MTESSFRRRFWLSRATRTAVVTPATAPPRTRDPERRKATARPGKTEWATASPMKAMPRRTTWVPTTPQTTADRTTMSRARGRKARVGLNRSVRKSIGVSTRCPSAGQGGSGAGGRVRGRGGLPTGLAPQPQGGQEGVAGADLEGADPRVGVGQGGGGA